MHSVCMWQHGGGQHRVETTQVHPCVQDEESMGGVDDGCGGGGGGDGG